MRYELRQPHELTPFDDMISATPDGVIVAVPGTADAIGNLIVAGFTIEGITEVFDDTSNVR